MRRFLIDLILKLDAILNRITKMFYAIRRKSDGALVSKPGSMRSYTPNQSQCQIFSTRYEAEKNLCPESESVVNLLDELIHRSS